MTDELYMQRCLELASLGMGNVSPNPLVGCVIVNNGKIIGEGYHQKFGEAHAEVNAIKSVTEKYGDQATALLANATAYVSLEPCAHFGKTPPVQIYWSNTDLKELLSAIEILLKA